MSMPSPEQQIEFLTKLQRLLAEGAFVATYKYALLMALADISIERGRDDDAPLEIPTRLIAEKFIQYYWRQTMPYLAEGQAEGEPLLRQNTGKQAGILKLVHYARRRFGDSLTLAGQDETAWRQLVQKVDGIVRVMPLWKLQTVGRGRLDFLYENSGRGTRITLRPGIAFCFRRHYSLIADLVRGAWARYVRRFNAGLLGDTADLQEFLFGSERASLAAVRPVLHEVQEGACFYCRRPLQADAAHVDHFIPWSRYPVDLGHNFVLAHATCNGRKSDRLASAEHLDDWVRHTADHGAEMGQEFNRAGIVHDIGASARIVNWAYTQAFQCGGLTWIRNEELQPLPPAWNQSLQRLLN